MGTDAKPQAKSRILDAVQETASDLQRLGFLGKRQQQKLLLRQRVHPGLVRAFEAQPDGAGVGVEHQRVHGAQVGNRGEASQRSVAEIVEPAGTQGVGCGAVSSEVWG